MSNHDSISIKTAKTETAMFQNLVLEAEDDAHITLDVDMESYLVFLLLRCNRASNMLHERVAFKFLNAGNKTGCARHHDLRDAGDSCLLLAGLFPEQAHRRMVTISYFIRVGRSCYHSLSGLLNRSHAELYAHLCEGFDAMRDVLQSIHDFHIQKKGLSPINAYDLWQETNNQRAWKTLSAHQGIPVKSTEQRYLF